MSFGMILGGLEIKFMMLDERFINLIKNKDVNTLCRIFYKGHKAAENLTPTQQYIIKKIAFPDKNRVNISAMTRYGKTQCVAFGIGLYIYFNKNKKIPLVGPKRDQTNILRNYMSELIYISPFLREIAELEGGGVERLKKESSKKRQTFKNGCQYEVFSAYNEGNALMGFGGELIILDERCLMSREAEAKIRRMLGDDPENAIMISLFNPWEVDSGAYDDWIDPNSENIRVDWKLALKEGRTTREFIDEMKRKLPPLAFTVLYESNFPEMTEDSIFNITWYQECIKNKFTLWEEVKKLRENISKAEQELERIKRENYPIHEKEKKIRQQESLINELKKDLSEYKVRISCDPADKGLDYTVIYWGVIHGSKYQLIGYFSEPTSDNMEIASKIYDIHKEIQSTEWFIDGHGLGVGVISRLNQIKKENKINVKVKDCLFGGSPTKKDIYKNLKAENYFRLRAILKENRIQLLDIPELKSELMKMKWKKSSEKTVIEDPKKSPDYADALVYFIWRDKKQLAWF
jgi:hypothetical protein